MNESQAITVTIIVAIIVVIEYTWIARKMLAIRRNAWKRYAR